MELRCVRVFGRLIWGCSGIGEKGRCEGCGDICPLPLAHKVFASWPNVREQVAVGKYHTARCELGLEGLEDVLDGSRDA